MASRRLTTALEVFGIFHLSCDSICSEARPEKNPAVVAGYCDPLFEGVCFEDEAERDECVRRCVQYVSRANGDCCGLGCD